LTSQRKVSYEQGKEFADTYGMKFIETSAKSADNVAEAFVTMTKEIISQSSDKSVKKEDEKKKVDLKNRGENLNSSSG
jgi:hypothetical protein